MIKEIINLPKYIMMLGIRAYQKTISPDHGLFKARFPHGYCKFYPSCSEYGHRAYKKHGFIKGTFLTIWRILRCNPWSKGGIDNVK